MTYTLSNSIAKALLLPVALAASFAGAQQLIIANPLDLDRPQEVVELPLERVLHAVHLKADQAAKIAAVDAATGKILPSQLYSSHANAALDTFLLLVQLPRKGPQESTPKSAGLRA